MSNTFWAAFLGSALAVCAVNIIIGLFEDFKDYLDRRRTDAFWDYLADLEYDEEDE